MFARDASNYSKMPLALDEWKAAGVGLVIAQAVDPPPAYPATQTVAQIDACLAAGLAVDCYIWIWFDLGPADIAAKLALLSGYTGGQIRQLWLDVEDVAAAKYDQAATEAKIAAALALCDAFPTSSGAPTGIYSGRWYWADPRYCNDTSAFSSRKLWSAEYDGIADAAVFSKFGGWGECAIKQYHGSQPDGTDLNVLSDAEAASMTPTPDPTPPPDDPCAALQVAHDSLVVTVADIADRLGDQLLAEVARPYSRKSVLKAIVTQIQKERSDSIGARP